MAKAAKPVGAGIKRSSYQRCYVLKRASRGQVTTGAMLLSDIPVDVSHLCTYGLPILAMESRSLEGEQLGQTPVTGDGPVLSWEVNHVRKKV